MNRKAEAIWLRAEQDNNWEYFLEAISPQQRSILVAMGCHTWSVSSLAASMLESERSIGSQVYKMEKESILTKTDLGLFAISNQQLAEAAQRWEAKPISLEDASRALEKAIYRASVGLFENLEHRRLIYGNGHHMAQKLAGSAVEMLKERWVQVTTETIENDSKS